MGCPQQCQRTRLAIAIVRGTGIVDAQEAVCLLTLTMLGYGRKILFRRGYSQMAGIQQPQSAPDEMNATTAPGRHSHNMVDRRQWLVRRHIEHFQNGTTDFHPDGARFIPASEYLDPEIVKAERAFLRTVPLMAAHSSQLPGPHAYRCEDILDVPVLLVRDAEGKAHAYLNSCSHRGARLLNEIGRASCRDRVCQYV